MAGFFFVFLYMAVIFINICPKFWIDNFSTGSSIIIRTTSDWMRASISPDVTSKMSVKFDSILNYLKFVNSMNISPIPSHCSLWLVEYRISVFHRCSEKFSNKNWVINKSLRRWKHSSLSRTCLLCPDTVLCVTWKTGLMLFMGIIRVMFIKSERGPADVSKFQIFCYRWYLIKY